MIDHDLCGQNGCDEIGDWTPLNDLAMVVFPKETFQHNNEGERSCQKDPARMIRGHWDVPKIPSVMWFPLGFNPVFIVLAPEFGLSHTAAKGRRLEFVVRVLIWNFNYTYGS